MPAIGYLTRQNDETFIGRLTTLTIQADMELRQNVAKADGARADYQVFVNGVEVGSGWKKTSLETQREYVSISLAAPEFGSKPIKANLGAIMGKEGDTYAVIWNPES